MKFPLSWLREFVQVPAGVSGAEIAEILTRIGFEEESVESVGADIAGPLVVGKVLEFVEEPQTNGKTIRWCQVEVAAGVVNGIVCGARNFFVGDKVVVVLPGAVLPGGFQITARNTYGHVSDGMICSARELQFGEDHAGILRLAELGLDPAVGSDAVGLLGLQDEVIDISVLADRGYAMSMRGIAREVAAATGWQWSDPALIDAPVVSSPTAVKVSIDDPSAAERIVLRTIENLDPAAPSPAWMQRRLQLCGMRSISLAVDVTNYVMLELGQPLHAFDADLVKGAIRVRRADPKQQLETLDHVVRELNDFDIVIADDSGPIALGGTMGGATTEVNQQTRRIALEACRFHAGSIARTSRLHKLSSEASRRLERGVDPMLASVASARAVALLTELGGAREVGANEVDLRTGAAPIDFPVGFAAALMGVDYSAAEIESALTAVGCQLQATATGWSVTPPTWRPDLVGPADLTEEVARSCGYDRIPSVVPAAPALADQSSTARKLRRSIANLLAANGLVEVLNYPFVGPADFDNLMLPESDSRRRAVELANPISATQPWLRTTLLPPLLATLQRNIGRGQTDCAVYEIGNVTLPEAALSDSPVLPIGERPTAAQLAALDAHVPAQPRYVAGAMTGAMQRGTAQVATADWDWQQAIAIAVATAEACGVAVSTVAADAAPWHPGRCAAIVAGADVIGFAGELHPRVCESLGIPARSVAFELDLTSLAAFAGGVVAAVPIATFPHALLDVALLVPADTPVESVRRTLLGAAGPLIESVRLFDVYVGDQVPTGQKSLAFTLEFRAADRTLTDSEVLPARDAAVAAAGQVFGAKLR